MSDPPRRLRMTLAQLKPTVGAIRANADKLMEAWEQGRAAGADIVCSSEMFLTGHSGQDMVRKRGFTLEAMQAVDELAGRTGHGPALAVGGPLLEGGQVFDAFHILQGGRVVTRIKKHHLRNGNGFDEVRQFSSGPVSGPFPVNGTRIGTPIGEDAWSPDVPEAQAESGAEMLFVPDSAPYCRGEFGRRVSIMVARVIETGLPMVYLNRVGGQDDRMYDGGSFVLKPGGRLAVQLPLFEECVAHVDLEEGEIGWHALPGKRATFPDEWEQDYRAMVETTRDFLAKCGVSAVLLGLSGGISSALVATIAADAIGPENVRAVTMPSDGTPARSLEDAQAVVDRLGLRHDSVPIAGPRGAIAEALGPLFAGTEPGRTDDDIPSGLRGLLLTAISNRFGDMLLGTGNKSELAVGRSTIHGDMNGRFNPLKDLYKTRVFETCRWRNANHRPWMRAPAGEVIPPHVIDALPTAGLRADRADEVGLPPYPMLDAILDGLVDREASVAELVAEGYDKATVKRVEHLLCLSENSRMRSSPGTRLTHRAFGPDRR